MGTLEADVDTNPEMDKAVTNFWKFISTFGDKNEWKKLEDSFHKVLEHSRKDPEFEDLLTDIGNSLQKLLTDPDFFDHVEEKFQELRKKARGVGTESSLRTDVERVPWSGTSDFRGSHARSRRCKSHQVDSQNLETFSLRSTPMPTVSSFKTPLMFSPYRLPFRLSNTFPFLA